MRILYFILKLTLNYTLRVFYPRLKLHNSPKHFFGRTIYVSNHPASFMDPISIAALRRPIVFFMTRSDVFTPIAKPFLWACQMLPIYRIRDGQESLGKNARVFRRSANVLKYGRGLLIFGEGFTDDVFIRRLKPVKKGPARIAFTALDNLNWEKKVYMVAVGANYSNPNQIRSDYLISHSERFCLNDYEQLYKENPNKAMTEVTRRIEKLMQEQITHVEDKNLAPFHENIMKLTRKGMNADNFDRSIGLKARWRYSQALANWLNEQNIGENEALAKLKDDTEGYFKLLKRFRLQERILFWKIQNPSGSRAKEVLKMIVLFPFAIAGVLHLGLPYILVKKWAEKSFRRKVFWGSVKLVAGKILMGLMNIPAIFLFYHFVFPSYWLALLYYVLIGLFGVAAYEWGLALRDFKLKGIINKADIRKFAKKRENLMNQIGEVLPAELR